MTNVLTRFRAAGVLIATLAAGLFASAPAQAGSSAGTIGVSLTVTAACAVNAATSVAATIGQLGSISFASQPGIFSNTDAAMVATGGGSGISVLCSPGLTPTFTVGAGANDDSTFHYLASNGSKVAYHLYSDAGRTSEITIGQVLNLGTATSTAFNVPIYGRVSSNGAALPAGNYTDTVQVTLAW
ncbi:Csu type fimbrial protein [Sphingomonas abietis]|uniref:Spore coat protein U domain-containing protein n=1 Tax=Sphingomonas abietis TaxID=3012344 RepID=A0ABY7NRD9_9SPHN|nr:spore coat protein U domain-containing protein [Sphingomonas abietis]WBO23011.1 spore coat protein U domain-containing protein [Sphingomonas abietis]